MKQNNRCGIERRVFNVFTQVVPEKRKGFDRRVVFDPSTLEWIDNQIDIASFNTNRSISRA